MLSVQARQVAELCALGSHHIVKISRQVTWTHVQLPENNFCFNVPAGHSLGGALAAVFAQALHARGHQELAARVKGVHTFGGERYQSLQAQQYCLVLLTMQHDVERA